MTTLQTTSRILHDLGGAAWFGGNLMGAVGLNGASKAVTDPVDRIPVATAGWARWTPLQAVGAGAHLLGGLGILLANRDRAATRQDVAVNTRTKLVLTVVAAGATAWAGVLGGKLAADGAVPAVSGVVPAAETPTGVKAAQQQLRALQWLIPSVMAVVMALSAQQGEQQARDAGSPEARDAAGWHRLVRRSS
ncbi:hypothetical protein [Quadrisphaera setariae]|uniref:hypothetical protein n=1 Tax=Quadrisphaera setariae TaxID=2593304 RepID=UPI0016502C38|nr:hypothetical protein [Quadrisphaera setariae]